MNKISCKTFIFARGGSKGVPRKNLKLLAGKPLIAYSIEIALNCPSLGSVIVSTDDDEIAEISRRYGANVPFMRPDELATDTASEWKAWQHAINWTELNEGEFDFFISLPVTSPFRSVLDVEACISALAKSPETDIIITVKKADRSPYFNMVRLDDLSNASLVIPIGEKILRRQDAPTVYDMTTVAYVARTSFIKKYSGVFDGNVKAIEIPVERALDIDTPYDFKLAEFLASEIK
ncbi:MAG TPA: acylneuraminate cytidylyltransferase family protein [Methylotenera sp.]|nr:acylneuraminate cytidylyltransferase family protein [Methylotenera sp.]HPH04755.1 acylneuraminate cytidylyltransferase family protein [Methylotenera sp.]HPN01198.1 acylneuraminate cytidylyltransferase family protein [Methylotenera sp.]